MSQAVEHDAARTFKKPWAGQKLLFRRHFPRSADLVEVQLVDQLLARFHLAVTVQIGQRRLEAGASVGDLASLNIPRLQCVETQTASELAMRG
jgi:hypothetical protein